MPVDRAGPHRLLRLPPLLKLELQYAVQCRVDADQDQLKRAKSGDFYLATSGANELAVDTVATC